MATITYKCNVCDRKIDLLENKIGLTSFSKCVITYGCKGKLLSIKRNPDNIRETFPAEVPGLEDYSQRKVLFNFVQNLPSNIWSISHDLNTSPSISVYLTDTDGRQYELNASEYTIVTENSNKLKLVFKHSYTGTAQLVSRTSSKVKPFTYSPTTPKVQATTNGTFVFAIPKYLTKFEYPPTILPAPSLPHDLQQGPIRIEVNIEKPNEEDEVCTEILDATLASTPWVGWGEILVKKRRNYYLFSKNILDFRTFGSDSLSFADIPEGTRLRITRIDYGTGVLQPLESEGLYILLTNSPYSTNDKVKNKLIDLGDMVDNTIDYLSFSESEFYVDESNVNKTYPDIIRISS